MILMTLFKSRLTGKTHPKTRYLDCVTSEVLNFIEITTFMYTTYLSVLLELPFGVPPGSMLDSGLDIIYALPLNNIVDQHFHGHIRYMSFDHLGQSIMTINY